jgi:hypothetical protein
MSARGISRLRQRLLFLGAYVADMQHVDLGQCFLVRTGRNRQRVMRPGTARAFAARLEDAQWGVLR